MDRTWILRGHLCSRSYVDGIQGFMKFVRTKEGPNQDVYCPCQTCMNGVKMTQRIVVTVSIHILNSLSLNLLQMDERAKHKKAALNEIGCSYGTYAMLDEKVNF